MSGLSELSSSNPFRRKTAESKTGEIGQAAVESSDDIRTTPSSSRIDALDDEASLSGTTSGRSQQPKRVRIVSPTSTDIGASTELDHKSSESRPALSTPPTHTQDEAGEDRRLPSAGIETGLNAAPTPLDPFESDSGDEVDDSSSGEEDEEAEERLEGESRPAELDKTQQPPLPREVPQQSASMSPSNPFRTVAPTKKVQPDRGLSSSTESQATITPEAAGPSQPRIRDEPFASSAGKGPSLDVDAFKRLILTGNTQVNDPPRSVPGPSSPTKLHHNQQSIRPVGDSGSSNTDASSISRQSITETVAASLTEPTVSDTPRTSHDSVLSDDERRQLVAEDERGKGVRRGGSVKHKPPPPKARHGKPIVGRSHASSISSQTARDATFRTPPGTPTSMSRFREIPPSPSSPGDLNKPLPPPPLSTSPEYSGATIVRLAENVPPGADVRPGTPSRRLPPNPPISRRNTQKVSSPPTQSLLPRTNSATVLGSQLESSQSEFAALTSSPRAAPAPPPARRPSSRRQTTSSSSSSIPTSSTSPFATPASPHTASTTSSSSSSITNKATSDPAADPLTKVTSSSSHHHTPPPPPPPRRHRGSSKSSTDETVSTSSTATATPVPPVPKIGGGRDTRGEADQDETEQEKLDVMADLSKLQREVDELRGKLQT